MQPDTSSGDAPESLFAGEHADFGLPISLLARTASFFFALNLAPLMSTRISQRLFQVTRAVSADRMISLPSTRKVFISTDKHPGAIAVATELPCSFPQLTSASHDVFLAIPKSVSTRADCTDTRKQDPQYVEPSSRSARSDRCMQSSNGAIKFAMPSHPSASSGFVESNPELAALAGDING